MKYIIFLISVIAGFVICESLLRINNAIKLNYDIEMWKYAKILKQKSENHKIGHIHQPNKSAFLQGVEIRINNRGFRGPSLESYPTIVDRRIMLIGSSITFGWGVEEEYVFSSILQKNALKDGKVWAVYNGGIGNYNTQRYVTNYIENWRDIEIDDLIVQYFINDTEVLEREFERKVNFFTKNTHAGVLLWKVLNSLNQDLRIENIKSYYEKLYMDDFEGYQEMIMQLEKLSNFCELKKINCYLLVTPDIHQLEPYELKFIHRKIKKIAEDLNFKTLDLLKTLNSLPAKKLWTLNNDPHPKALGHKLM